MILSSCVVSLAVRIEVFGVLDSRCCGFLGGFYWMREMEGACGIWGASFRLLSHSQIFFLPGARGCLCL